jgi:hypothetical protein
VALQYGLGWTHLLKLVALPVAYGCFFFQENVEIDYMFLRTLLGFTEYYYISISQLPQHTM